MVSFARVFTTLSLALTGTVSIAQHTSAPPTTTPPAWWAIPEIWTAVGTVALAIVTSVLALYTYRLWRATKQMVGDARAEAEMQGQRMQAAAAEATRASAAMERVAESMERSANHTAENVELLRQRTGAQLRAYLFVEHGAAVYQDRERGLRFEGKAILKNLGHSPASGLRYWASASIQPFPIPANFNFPVGVDQQEGTVALGPGQALELNAVVDNYVPDEEVAEIKAGTRRRLLMWGVVSYQDIFGEAHQTRFSCTFAWFGEHPNERISGSYPSRHHEAT